MLSAVLVCLVVGVADGDTLTVRCPSGDATHPYQQVKVRLAEIDAPESGQAYGRRSKEHLSDLCYQVDATIRPTATDRYGRTVARVECRGKDANLEQVRMGLAWAFTKYQSDAQFPRMELAARASRVGLWVDLGTASPPVAPWDFRHPPPGQAQQASPDANGCYTGPKGGRYRLLPDGRKLYGC